eukprot:4848470-Amphidinium_carterae.1
MAYESELTTMREWHMRQAEINGSGVVCKELDWKAEVVRQFNKRTWLVVADEEPVVWRQLVESGYECTTVWIRPYEERSRPNHDKTYEVRSGQRAWAS